MISKDGKSVNAAKILAVMSLGAKQGQTVEFTIEGEDEVQAIGERLKSLINTDTILITKSDVEYCFL